MWKFALVLLFLSCFGHGRRSLRSHQQPRNGLVHDGVLHSQSRAQAGPHGTLGTLNAFARLLRAISSPAAFTAGSRGQHLLRRTSPALHTAAVRVCLPVQASTDIPAFFPAVPEFCCETCGFTIFPAFGNKQNVLNDKFRCPTCGTAKDDFFEVADMSDPRAVKARETGLPRIAAAQAPPLALNQEAQGPVASPEEAALPSPPEQDQSPAPAAEGIQVKVRKKTKTDEPPAPAAEGAEVKVRKKTKTDEPPAPDAEGAEVKVRKKTEFDFTEQQVAQFQAAFAKLDLNGDGTIEAKELGAMMTSLGYSYSEAELQAIINEFDANGNGSLEFPEFLSLIARKMKEDKSGKLQQEPAPPASTEEAPPPTSPEQELKQEVEKLQQAPAPPLEQVAQEVEQDTEEEEESDDVEHEFRCEKCGYTLFPARGREGKFFPDDFKCMMCKAPKDAFFDMADLSDPRTVAALEEEGYEVVTEEEVAAEEKAAGLPVEDEIAEKKDEGYAHSQVPETAASAPSAEDQSPAPAAEGLEVKVRKKTNTDESPALAAEGLEVKVRKKTKTDQSPAPAAEGLETKTDESPAPAAEEFEIKVRKKTETDQSPPPAAEGLEVKVRKKTKTDQSPAPAAEGLETKTDESPAPAAEELEIKVRKKTETDQSPAPAAEGLEIKVRKKTESAAQPSAGSSEAIAPPASPEASETAPPHEDRYRGGVRPPVDNWSAFKNYSPPPVHQLSRRQDPNADKASLQNEDLWQQAEAQDKVTSTSEEGLESAMAAFRKKAGVSPSPAPSPPMPSEAKVETKIRSPAESTPAPSPPVSSEDKVESKIRPPSPRVPAEGDSESNIQTGTSAPSPPLPAEGDVRVRVKIRRPKKD